MDKEEFLLVITNRLVGWIESLDYDPDIDVGTEQYYKDLERMHEQGYSMADAFRYFQCMDQIGSTEEILLKRMSEIRAKYDPDSKNKKPTHSEFLKCAKGPAVHEEPDKEWWNNQDWLKE